MTDTLTIRYMRLDDAAKLRWRKNPKLHDIGAIVESIRRYGFIDPPGFDATLGAFTYGNGRDEALEWMYAQGEPLPRGILVADDGMWLMPVKVGLDQATAEQAEALALDHNNLTLSGGPFTAYDMARMWGEGYTEILASLATADALPITVDGDALDGLLAELSTPEPGAGGDEFDTTPEDGPTRTQPGDLWIIGGTHRLLVGDCTDPANVERLMQGERARGAILDPPYGMRLDTDFSAMENKDSKDRSFSRGNKYDTVEGDDQDYDASPVALLLKSVDEQFWFGADYYSATLGDTMHGGAWLVWDKRDEGALDDMFGSCFELIWSRRKHKRDILRCRWAGPFGTEHEKIRERTHPNQKPVRLYEDLMGRYLPAGAIVIDLYAGSGVTLTAAHSTGRRAYLCELLPKYADVILRRAEAEGLECVRDA